MDDSVLEHVTINFSARSVTILSDKGEEKTVEWKWDDEGAQGFAEVVGAIEAVTEAEDRTYQFAVVE
tara:strand:+ start:3213 stop:3413 length:201 start_codon:yes stop_codon:yes gene_type:complete